jgi:glycosyl hydrolase family 64 (putative beta-1,3-glucanase)/carbohydrate binding protein with CBM56 domain
MKRLLKSKYIAWLTLVLILLAAIPYAVAHAAADFTQGVTALSSTQVKIWFTPTTASTLVDVHYLNNGANQQNFRMTNNNGTWEQTVSNLSNGTVLEYWFTYEKSGPLYDTSHFTYTVGSSGSTPTPTPTTSSGGGSSNGTFPVTLQNNTNGKWANNQIYILIFGMNASGQWCYVKPDGSMVPINPADANAPNHLTKNGVNYANYSFTLAQAPTFTAPSSIVGGRMYISLGSPLFIPISNNGWGGPDLSNPTDPNLDVIFDWYEFAYVYNKTPFGGNTTQVDMFGFPMTARLQQSAINYDQTVGITLTRDQVFSQYASAVGAAFKPLANTYRIVSPRKGDFKQGGSQANYMQSYIDQVWSYYTSNPFSYQRGGDTFAGKVVNNQLQFSKNGAGSYSIGKPTTSDVMACENTLATGSGVEKDLEAELCAAFNRGVAQNTANWRNPSTYYTNSIKNDYAMFWHQIGIDHRAYGFAYDDVNDQSSVKILPNANPPSNLTIGIGW